MKRSVVVATVIVLALATVLALVGLAATLAAPGARATRAAETAGIVRSFYAAANDAVRTGDPTAIDAIVSGAFVERGAGDEPGSDLERLRRRLVVLHAAHPDLRFQVRNVVADRGQAVAHIALEGLAVGAPLVLPAVGPIPADLIDRFRVAAGRIVAYAGVAADLTVPVPLAAAMFEVRPTPAAWLGVARLGLDPGAGIPVLVGSGPMAYAVESGAVVIRIDGEGRVLRVPGNGGPAEPVVVVRRGEVTLGPGTTIVMRSGVTHALRNDGAVTASVLATAVLPASALIAVGPSGVASAPPPAGLPSFAASVSPSVAMFATSTATNETAAWPEGVTTTPLAAERIVPNRLGRGGRIQVAVARLTMAASTHVLLPDAPGPTLLAVEAGTALMNGLESESGGAEPHPAVLLDAGTATTRDAGATAIQAVAVDPLSVLVIMLGP